ncbi:60S ribosomal protein L27-like [Sorex fumeus]|uniref:60S ribosomal protein L27-like n=1 Tax=Sorex fumeus TaxID=62283 RepID=UPI0024AE363F|nr:60S ribosomal protein L27-like [Sorex fumeus]
MRLFMKPWNVVLILVRCYLGHKAITIKNVADGTSDCPHSHALVAGIDHYPCKVTAATGKKKITKRFKIKSSVKVYKYSHLMLKRYTVDILLDKIILNKDVFRDPAL